MKKTERHQIKRDDLATVLESALLYAEENRRAVLVGAVAALVLIVGVLGAREWWESRQAESARLLGDLISTYNSPITATLDDLQQARPGAPTFTSLEERSRKVIEAAGKVLSEGGSGVAGGALLYRGLAEADLNQTDAAVRDLQDVSRRFGGTVFAPTGRLRLARLLEGSGRPAEALPVYQSIADDASGLMPREEGLLGMARCQEAQGKKSEALTLYRRVLSEFPNSGYAAEARDRVADLS